MSKLNEKEIKNAQIIGQLISLVDSAQWRYYKDKFKSQPATTIQQESFKMLSVSPETLIKNLHDKINIYNARNFKFIKLCSELDFDAIKSAMQKNRVLFYNICVQAYAQDIIRLVNEKLAKKEKNVTETTQELIEGVDFEEEPEEDFEEEPEEDFEEEPEEDFEEEPEEDFEKEPEEDFEEEPEEDFEEE